MTNFFPAPETSVIVKDTIPIEIFCKAAAADIVPRMLVETVQTADTDADRNDITKAAANTKTALGWVLMNFANRITLGQATQNPTKASTFADNDGVWVGLKIPVVEAILKEGQGTVLPGKRMICGGDGELIIHPDNLAVSTHTTGTTVTNTLTGYALDPTVAIMLSRTTTSDTTQVVQVMPLW